MGKSKRNGLVDFLKFYFAVIVFLRHSREFVPENIVDLFQRGALAVEYFFIVSGVLMASSAKKVSQKSEVKIGTETINFIKHKYFQLMPEFFVAWVISFVVFVIRKFNSLNFVSFITYFKNWLFNLIPLSILGFSRGQFYMGSWYISAMLIAMYLLFPFCVKYFDTFSKIASPLISLTILGCFELCLHTPLGPNYLIGGGLMFKGLIRAVAEICLGIALYNIIEKMKKSNFSRKTKTVFSFDLLISLIAVSAWMIFGKSNRFDTTSIFVICLIVLLAFSEQTYGFELLNNSFVYGLGKMSMLLYFCHVEYSHFVAWMYETYNNTLFIFKNSVLIDYFIMLMMYAAFTIITMILVNFISKKIRKTEFFKRLA